MHELLTRGIEELRTPVPVRAAWRDAVVREIVAAPPPMAAVRATRDTRRAVSLRPLAAAAAAVLILTMGVGAGAYLTRTASDIVGAAPNAAVGLTTVRFVIVAPTARRVSLVGDFNRWNATANPMRASRDGRSWVLEVPLAPGRHTYAFVVDGDVLHDPAAATLVDDDFGVRNSVIFVSGGGT